MLISIDVEVYGHLMFRLLVMLEILTQLHNLILRFEPQSLWKNGNTRKEETSNRIFLR